MKKNFTEHHQYYNQAKYYDIAFDFRNVEHECQFFINCYKSVYKKSPISFLELAAGPAQHTRWMAKNKFLAAGLDLSSEMVEYGLSLAEKQQLNINYHQADMINFSLTDTFDLCVLLMDSASYILSNEDMIKHLQNVARHLTHQSLYILEMAHPRELFKTGSQTNTDWMMERDGIQVHTQWGNPDDIFDPISQISQVTAKMTVTHSDKSVEVFEAQSPQRSFSATGFDALVKSSGVFKIIKQFGSLDSNIAFSNDSKAWRMVSVLAPL